MKQLLIYITCLIGVWSSLIHSAPLSAFLSGGVIAEVVTTPVTAITFVGSTTGSFSGTVSPTITYPTAVQNDILIVIMASDSSPDSNGTPPTGWTKLDQTEHSPASPTSTVHTFWKRATATVITSETWPNILSVGPATVFASLCYRGCITTESPIDVSSTGSSAFTGLLSTGNITTSGTDRMLVGIFGGDIVQTTTFTWGAGISERVEIIGAGSTGAIAAGDILVSSAGTYSMTCTPSSGVSAARFIYALKPAPAV